MKLKKRNPSLQKVVVKEWPLTGPSLLNRVKFQTLSQVGIISIIIIKIKIGVLMEIPLLLHSPKSLQIPIIIKINIMFHMHQHLQIPTTLLTIHIHHHRRRRRHRRLHTSRRRHHHHQLLCIIPLVVSIATSHLHRHRPCRHHHHLPRFRLLLLPRQLRTTTRSGVSRSLPSLAGANTSIPITALLTNSTSSSSLPFR